MDKCYAWKLKFNRFKIATFRESLVSNLGNALRNDNVFNTVIIESTVADSLKITACFKINCRKLFTICKSAVPNRSDGCRDCDPIEFFIILKCCCTNSLKF